MGYYFFQGGFELRFVGVLVDRVDQVANRCLLQFVRVAGYLQESVEFFQTFLALAGMFVWPVAAWRAR